ncbi:hypothetical protein [Roseateles oligotrophus]|uniref:Uncharacterized protein n=1 Tax=Roseateles oligotrophus TaxID=1769250 RepID=A0ABT2YFU5_9BURK|nr:hypothetical protein [Roseateles oligotrophus]MCV2368881.1 hypothetical protein [Roseateles oligotrophus]
MNRRLGLLSLLCLATTMASGAAKADLQEHALELSVGQALGELPRFGVNLGARNVWGADQLIRNILQNPGLELGHDGALLIVGRALPDGVQDEHRWTARAAGFWAGANFEVLSGAAAGQRGRVLDNRPPAASDRNRGDLLQLEPPPAGLRPGDVLALQGQQDRLPAPLWWTQGLVRSVAEPRPGSPGQRALHLIAGSAQPAALFHHLDALGARAGKLLPINGRWTLSFWARNPSASPSMLRLSFGRQGRSDWLQRELSPGAQWQQHQFDFDGDDKGPAGPLQLALQIERGQVLLDDIELTPKLAPPLDHAAQTGFRAELIETLQQLRPGYLRDWQGQLGDSLSNRLAEPLARRPTRYRPGPNEQLFAYSIPEFLRLCGLIGARPWLVLPSSSSPEDAQRLGRLLAESQRQYGFDEIVVEHGNEHWNSIFLPAGIAKAASLAEVADRVFAALKQGAGPAVALHRVIGSQYVNPATAADLLKLSRHSEGVAVAPYFHYEQDSAQTLAQILPQLLHEGAEPLQTTLKMAAAWQRSVDVYEVNFHTTGGNASGAQRNAVLADPAAGTALVRRLLQAALLGVRRQAVYSLSGFDTYMGSLGAGQPRGLVELFGITRDLSQAAQWRPTGQALQAINQVVGGSAHAVACQGQACPELTALAFADGRRWIITNSAARPLRLSLPCAAAMRVSSAAGSGPVSACKRGRLELSLPAHGWLTAQQI